VTVDGYVVPAGLYLVPSLALVHLRDDLYPEPHAFRPERFLEGQPEPYAWIPFGGGVRRCIGAAFAAFEMKTVLRTVLLRTRLEAPRPRSEPPRMRHVTAAPARGAVAILVQRSG
jgi:cytochrome P450